MNKKITTPWKSQNNGFAEAINYMTKRKAGLITSIKTPWAKFNDATIDGLEWNTINIIAGRPGTGKTCIKDLIITEAHNLNPNEKFRVLEFQLEMHPRVTALRRYSSKTRTSYKQLCSAEGIVDDAIIEQCKQYAINNSNAPIDVVDTSVTVDEFEQIIDKYMEDFHFVETVNQADDSSISIKRHTKTIITLDHSILLKKASNEKDKQETLHNLGERLTKLKKKYPVIFIILSQLNRNVESLDRNEDGKYGNYILTSDIFGGDALLQHADIVVGLNLPGKYNIKFYGPERFIIADKRVLVMHFLKCRNGETGMSFFNTEFEYMIINEALTPPKQNLRTI